MPSNPSADIENDPIAEEIAKRLGSLLPSGQKAQVIAQMTSLIVEERFSGPIPHPRHFGEYEKHLPGSAAELMDMAKSNLAHQQQIQTRMLEADISDMKESRRLGFAALIVLIIGAIICGILEKDYIAYALLGTSVIGTINQIIKGRGRD